MVVALNGDIVNLFLVCDISGSMIENGKNMLTRGIVREVEQYVRLECRNVMPKLVLWNSSSTITEWGADDELPDSFYDCHGNVNATSLRDLLKVPDRGKILILTDGWWPKEEVFVMKKWKSMLPEDTLRIIKIGSDANPLLKGADVFSTDTFFCALDNWLPILTESSSNEGKDSW